ncbi:MAG: tetratricopeptide repeat protein, partial [Steroidobacteraceae bacterium]
MDAYANRGNALRSLHRLEEALQSYEQAALINPTFLQAHYNRGLVLRQLG